MDTTETTIFNSLIIAGFIIGLIILYCIIYLLYENRQLYELKKVFMMREFTAIEKERQRIAHDLHDDLGPTLCSIKIALNSLSISDKKDILKRDKLIEVLGRSIEKLKTISYNLNTPCITLTWEESIQNVISLIEKGEIRIAFIAKHTRNINHEKGAQLVRAIQEILHNAIKHSECANIFITTYNYRNLIVINIFEDGKGFEVKEAWKEKKGLGLSNIVNRIGIIQGRLRIESRLGQGTIYRINIPL